MRKLNLYKLGMSAIILAGMTACQDDFDAPSLEIPQATMTPNTTILDVKTKYWDDATNYIKEIGLTEAGEHVIISGRVISSDATGNIYKNLVIQDESAALAMSINANSMYNDYRLGQEIVIDLTEMHIGKYNGLQQLGFPEYSDQYGWEATFMPPEIFYAHSQLNGLPEPEKMDTVTIRLSDLPSAPEGLRKWQSQLVRINNVSFTGGGELPFSEEDASTNRTITDTNGNSLTVRNSNYASFKSDILPAGNGDVVGILSYYGTSGWQLLLRFASDCMNFGNPTMEQGTEENPYTVEQAKELIGNDSFGWLTGYIVGAVSPEVETTITSNDDIEWGAPTVLATTLVIGATPDTKDLNDCFVIALPQGSALRQYGNLKDNAVYQRQIWVSGTFGTYMGANGVLDNSGSTAEFKIEGVEIDTGEVKDGNGTEDSPYSVTQVLDGSATGTAWVSGYIVGWIDGMTLSTGATFNASSTIETNVLIAATQGETDVNKCIPVQLPAGAIRSAVNLKSHPENFGKMLSVNASIEKYFGVMGLKSATEYELVGDSSAGGDSGEATLVTSINETFDSGVSGWKNVVVTGTKSWVGKSYSDNYYASCSGYGGSGEAESWLISSPIDIANCTNKVLTFDNQVCSYDSTGSILEVYVMTSDNPTTATKTKLNATYAVAPGGTTWSSWVSSGNLDLSSYTGTIYIGFRYYSPSADSATWAIDNVKL